METEVDGEVIYIRSRYSSDLPDILKTTRGVFRVIPFNIDDKDNHAQHIPWRFGAVEEKWVYINLADDPVRNWYYHQKVGLWTIEFPEDGIRVAFSNGVFLKEHEVPFLFPPSELSDQPS